MTVSTHTPLQRSVLEFVARGGLVTVDQLINRFIRINKDELFQDARPRGEAMLKRLLLRGYLNARPVVVDCAHAELAGKPSQFLAKHYWTRAFYITPRTSWEFNLPLPPCMRDNIVSHHLKTMDALLVAEKALGQQGCRVKSFKGEAQLIREQFSGRVFGGKDSHVLPNFPDAQLHVEAPDGTFRLINLEYVTAKYTDAMIRQKAAGFSGETLWAVDGPSTAARVTAITGQRPITV